MHSKEVSFNGSSGASPSPTKGFLPGPSDANTRIRKRSVWHKPEDGSLTSPSPLARKGSRWKTAGSSLADSFLNRSKSEDPMWKQKEDVRKQRRIPGRTLTRRISGKIGNDYTSTEAIFTRDSLKEAIAPLGEDETIRGIDRLVGPTHSSSPPSHVLLILNCSLRTSLQP